VLCLLRLALSVVGIGRNSLTKCSLKDNELNDVVVEEVLMSRHEWSKGTFLTGKHLMAKMDTQQSRTNYAAVSACMITKTPYVAIWKLCSADELLSWPKPVKC